MQNITITLDELKMFIASKHNPELATKPGMVWQVWEDGELTLQKSGDLLWQRSLHSIQSGIVSNIPTSVMPIQESKHGYAFIENEEVGKAIREKMLEFIKQLI